MQITHVESDGSASLRCNILHTGIREWLELYLMLLYRSNASELLLLVMSRYLTDGQAVRTAKEGSQHYEEMETAQMCKLRRILFAPQVRI